MSIKTVLFDLDSALLPMDQEVFISTYAIHYGEKGKQNLPLFDDFYKNEFDLCGTITGRF